MTNKLSFLSWIVIYGLSIFSMHGCGIMATTQSTSIAAQDRRPPTNFINDQTIAIKASLALVKDHSLWKQSHISTLSYNNTLLLVGQTPSKELKQQADIILLGIPEISKIYNQLDITKPIPFTLRAKDAWITTQIKAKLISSRDIGPSRVKAITENGVVYLMGILTQDEEDIATNIARKINGVKEVIKIFERFDYVTT